MTGDPESWELRMASSGVKALDRLPEKAAAAVVEFVLGPLLADPRRVGRPLRGRLAGSWSARRGPYRVIYELDDTAHVLRVLHVDHRSDVYRRRG